MKKIGAFILAVLVMMTGTTLAQEMKQMKPAMTKSDTSMMNKSMKKSSMKRMKMKKSSKNMKMKSSKKDSTMMNKKMMMKGKNPKPSMD
ncbi:MAG TPA: hypothetical protein VLX91_16750 [Candidatus Acidoferrales bacterium]|nr:hypothetical protein [Candidatus Acidoferrales bacterium]